MKTILSVSLLICAITTFSQTKQDTIHKKATQLNEVEVTATSSSNKSLLNQPASISKLGIKELKRGTGLFLDDAININVPGVLMERRTVSAGQQFNIRGYGNGIRGTNGSNSNFDTQGTKVYLNNIPVTDAEGITLMDDIDFASIGNVEILKGPSGSLYGLAIAGVVNLKTIKPESGKTSITQNALFGSYGLQRFTTQLQIGGEKSSFLVNYGKQKYDGFMDHTASDKTFVNLYGDFNLSDKQKINAYLGYSDSYDQRNGELTIAQYENLDYTGNPAYIKNDAHSNVISVRAGLNHMYQFNKNISNSTSLFGTGISSNVSSAGGWTDKLPVNYGLRSTFDTRFGLNDNLKLSGITGIEYQQQNAQTIGYNMVNGLIDAAKSNMYTISKTNSLFTEWTLLLPKDFSITAGVGSSYMGIQSKDRFMYDPANTKYSTYVRQDFTTSYKNMISPKFAINKVFSNEMSVYASYSKGYKAPVAANIFIPGNNTVNTNLRPEIGNQFEVGSKGNLFNDRLNYQVAAFQTIYSDKMTAVAVPNAAGTATAYSYIVNAGKQDHKGIEALVKYEIYKSNDGFVKSIFPFANVTYSDFKYDEYVFQRTYNRSFDFSGNQVLGTPKVVFNTGIDFITKIGFYGNTTFSHRDPMPFSYVPEKVTDTQMVNYRTSSINLLNAKVGFQKRIVNHLDFDASVGVDNITNTQSYQMVFLNQLPDAYLPAPLKATFFGGVNLKYTF